VSNQNPQFRPPADRDDDWVAVVIALGALGGLLGWIIFQPNGLQRAQSTIESHQLLAPTNQSEVAAKAPNQTLTDAAPEQTRARDQNSLSPATDSPAAGQSDNVSEDTRLIWPQLSPPTEALNAIALRLGSSTSGSNASPTAQQPLTVPEPSVPTADQQINPELPAPAAPLAFSDLSPEHWAKQYIDALTARGILAGFPDGTFEPDQAMTRAELATQVARAFDLPDQTAAPPTFVDIPTSYWATDGIQAAVKMGFMQGYPDGVFQPGQTVPRVQVIAAIAAGLQLQSAEPTAVLPQYSDQMEIPEWAREKVAAATTADIISGQPDQLELRPNEPATRAEVAAILYYALVYLGALPAE
jgi:hypothetical protein